MSRIREEEEDHSTPNLFDNLAIGIADRIMIDRRSMGLESFFNGKANFYWSVDFTVLRYLPCIRRIDKCKILGSGPLLEKFNGKLEIWGTISCPIMNFWGRPNPHSMRHNRPRLTSETRVIPPAIGRGEIFFSIFSRGLLPLKFWRVHWPSEFHHTHFRESGSWGTNYVWHGNVIPR